MRKPSFPYIKTPRPAKDLLFKWIKRDLKEIGRVDSVGDIGCAELAFLDWFNFKKYYAYDIDIQRPEKVANNLKEKIYLSELDITKSNTTNKHSLIFCIQVMIGNISFDMSEVEKTDNAQLNTIMSREYKWKDVSRRDLSELEQFSTVDNVFKERTFFIVGDMIGRAIFIVVRYYHDDLKD